MILTHDYLRQSSPRMIYESTNSFQQRIVNVNDETFRKKQNFDIFLSHSSLDHDEVLSLLDNKLR